MASGSEILERQVSELKHELKQWERGVVARCGRKPTKDDIRNDASISAKYREYDRLRRPTSFAKPAETPRKDRHIKPGSAHKRNALRERSGNATATTPNRVEQGANMLAIVHEEEPEIEPTPAFIRSGLGPTPQKDGQVLGIFDMPTTATPSKSLSMPAIPTLSTIGESPSKPSAAPPSASSEPALSATPQSASKRRFLDAFAGTPLKRKHEDDGGTPSTAKRQYATPSFLRRSFPPLAPIEEESGSSAPPFKKRGGFVRSLSSMIQNLRKNEEKRMDDEWDILNELEAEERGEAPEQPEQTSKVLVEDSQVQEMPLGPDRAPESEDEGQSGDEQTALDPNGQPRKPWKKKGLKRQTRRVIMRPVTHQPKKAAELNASNDDGEDVVEETQLQDCQTRDGGENAEGAVSGEDDVSDFEGSSKSGTARRKGKQRPPPVGARADDVEPEAKGAKKVSAQAHANFRRLNIKNKNSKANGKGRGFGRRR